MITNEHDRHGRVRLPRRTGLAMAALLLIGAVLTGCGDSDEASSSDVRAALDAWSDGINTHSLDDTMAAFADDALLIDHPLNPGVLSGKSEIIRGVRVTVESARLDPNAYSVSDVVVTGNTVSWSYVWVNDADQRFCSVGNEIDVDGDGLIVEMRWGPDPGSCDR